MSDKVNKIKLTDLLQACLDFKKKPTADNEAKIAGMINQLIIKEYMSLVDKQIAVAATLSYIPEDSMDALVAENWLLLGKVVYGLLGYVTNLENDLDRMAMTPAVVDILYEFHIVDAILEHAKEDYHRFEQMLAETLNFSNIFRLLDTIALMDPSQLDTFINALKEFKADLTPEMLTDLKKLAVAGSAEYKAFKDTIVEEALENAVEENMAKITEPKPETKETPEETEVKEA